MVLNLHKSVQMSYFFLSFLRKGYFIYIMFNRSTYWPYVFASFIIVNEKSLMISNWLSETVKSKDRQYNGQWKTKKLKDKQWSIKTLYWTKDWTTRTLLRTVDELGGSGTISGTHYTNNTLRGIRIKNTVLSRQLGRLYNNKRHQNLIKILFTYRIHFDNLFLSITFFVY